jgi:Flp pilus assembly protein TadG
MKKMFLQGEQGAAVVEFAIIVSLLFTLVFGIIEFGVLMFDKHVFTNASREGARAGVVMRETRVTDAEIEIIVNRYAENFMVSFGSSSTLQTSVTPVGPRTGGTLFGTPMTVSVTYPFDFLFLSSLGLGPIPLEAITTMRME